MARTPAFPEAIPLGPLSALLRRSLLARQGSALDRGCVKTSARFHTGLFRSLLRGLRAFRVEKITNNLALLDRLKNFGEFLHGLDPERSLVGQKSRIPRRDFETEKSGLLLDICNGERLVCLVFNKTNISRFMRKLYGAPLEFHFWLVSGPAAANGRQFRNPILAENPTNAAGWESHLSKIVFERGKTFVAGVTFVKRRHNLLPSSSETAWARFLNVRCGGLPSQNLHSKGLLPRTIFLFRVPSPVNIRLV